MKANRTVGVMLRLRPAEQARIISCAERQGLSVSAWMRMQLLEVLRRVEEKTSKKARRKA